MQGLTRYLHHFHWVPFIHYPFLLSLSFALLLPSLPSFLFSISFLFSFPLSPFSLLLYSVFLHLCFEDHRHKSPQSLLQDSDSGSCFQTFSLAALGPGLGICLFNKSGDFSAHPFEHHLLWTETLVWLASECSIHSYAFKQDEFS